MKLRRRSNCEIRRPLPFAHARGRFAASSLTKERRSAEKVPARAGNVAAMNAAAWTASDWYAEMSPMQMAPGSAGVPAVEFQQARQPMLRLESPWAPMLYVFVHQIVDGRPPGVPVPPGLLERAQQQGGLR